MSTELDDIAAAFADVQNRTDNIADSETKAAIDRAIDAVLMGIGSLERRLKRIEQAYLRTIQPNEKQSPLFDGLPKITKN